LHFLTTTLLEDVVAFVVTLDPAEAGNDRDR